MLAVFSEAFVQFWNTPPRLSNDARAQAADCDKVIISLIARGGACTNRLQSTEIDGFLSVSLVMGKDFFKLFRH